METIQIPLLEYNALLRFKDSFLSLREKLEDIDNDYEVKDEIIAQMKKREANEDEWLSEQSSNEAFDKLLRNV